MRNIVKLDGLCLIQNRIYFEFKIKRLQTRNKTISKTERDIEKKKKETK